SPEPDQRQLLQLPCWLGKREQDDRRTERSSDVVERFVLITAAAKRGRRNPPFPFVYGPISRFSPSKTGYFADVNFGRFWHVNRLLSVKKWQKLHAKEPPQPALTCTDSISTGAATNRACSSADDENFFPATCRAGNRKLSERSANGYGSSTKRRDPADRTSTRAWPPPRSGNGCSR